MICGACARIGTNDPRKLSHSPDCKAGKLGECSLCERYGAIVLVSSDGLSVCNRCFDHDNEVQEDGAP